MSQDNSTLMEDLSSETMDEVKEPPMYKVFLLNDDYTTMDFVVHILMSVFYKSFEDANRIMMNVHKNGSGLCGLYTFEVAETKVDIVQNIANDNGFPLKCIMEQE